MFVFGLDTHPVAKTLLYLFFVFPVDAEIYLGRSSKTPAVSQIDAEHLEVGRDVVTHSLERGWLLFEARELHVQSDCRRRSFFVTIGSKRHMTVGFCVTPRLVTDNMFTSRAVMGQ